MYRIWYIVYHHGYTKPTGRGLMGDDATEERKLTRTVRRRMTEPGTGQVFDFEWEEPLKRRPAARGRSAEPFCLLFPEGVERLISLGLQGSDLDVFWQLVRGMGFEEPFRYSTGEIADALAMRSQHVSRALANLRHAGLLITVGPPRDRRILIDPLIVWRGSIQSRTAWLARLDPPKKVRPE